MVGISTDVSIVNCGSIPRSEGKACRVFDLRKAAANVRSRPGRVSSRARSSIRSCAMIHKGHQ
ncbi:hypothetical protein ACLK2F_07955 [Escherichia coli]